MDHRKNRNNNMQHSLSPSRPSLITSHSNTRSRISSSVSSSSSSSSSSPSLSSSSSIMSFLLVGSKIILFQLPVVIISLFLLSSCINNNNSFVIASTSTRARARASDSDNGRSGSSNGRKLQGGGNNNAANNNGGSSGSTSSGFNYEIEKRVHERVSELMNIPVIMLGLVERYSETNIFEPPFLRPHQSEELFTFIWTVWQEFGVDLYYGQEDGLFLGLIKGSGTYLEGLGTNGYHVQSSSISSDSNSNSNSTNSIIITDEDLYMKRLYYNQCLNRTSGEEQECILEEEEDYIECIDNCHKLIPCNNVNNDNPDNVLLSEQKQDGVLEEASVTVASVAKTKEEIWCPMYEVKQVPSSTTTSITNVSTATTMGYIPRYYYCLNDSGSFIENVPSNSVASPISMVENESEDGSTSTSSNGYGYGSCSYGDGTLVNGKTSVKDTYAICHRNNYMFLQQDQDNEDQESASSLVSITDDQVDIRFDFDEDNDVEEENETKCDTPFVGGYHSRRYEPRLRPWYIGVRELQNSFWTKPYPFATTNDMGISYGKPIYYTEPSTGQKIFRGVICVDYDLEEISKFLKTVFLDILDNDDDDNDVMDGEQDDTSSSSSSSSSNTGATVLIVEDDEPHYIIGSSTGSPATKKVRVDDESINCNEEQIFSGEYECTTVRSTPKDFTNSVLDIVMSSAFQAQNEAGFPKQLVVSSSSSDNNDNDNDLYYVSQSLTFEQSEGENLRWRIIVAMPVGLATNEDSLLFGDPMFVVVLAIGLLGFILCVILFYYYFTKRLSTEVALSDWRFTSAFIIGCSLLNLSMLTNLGPASNSICMLRMWSFHICFVLALSPLLVKVWRIYKLVGSAGRARRLSITNQKTAIYTLPAILLQVLILTLFSILDPATKYTYVDIDGSSSSQHSVCKHETNGFAITEIIFEGGLVLAGCILAFMTRNLGSTLGEAKQLLFAMYNVALVALIVILMGFFLTIDQQAVYVIMTVGVFWATVFSSCAFVLPRLLQVQKRKRNSSKGSSFGHSSMYGGSMFNRSSEFEAGGTRSTPVDKPKTYDTSTAAASAHVIPQMSDVFADDATNNVVSNDNDEDNSKNEREGKMKKRDTAPTEQSISTSIRDVEALQDLAASSDDDRSEEGRERDIVIEMEEAFDTVDASIKSTTV